MVEVGLGGYLVGVGAEAVEVCLSPGVVGIKGSTIIFADGAAEGVAGEVLDGAAIRSDDEGTGGVAADFAAEGEHVGAAAGAVAEGAPRGGEGGRTRDVDNL